jgi:hypothetical protein
MQEDFVAVTDELLCVGTVDLMGDYKLEYKFRMKLS